MKKKQKSAQPPITTAVSDLKSIIHDHSLFFDKLIELIPSRFYLPSDDVNDAKPWFQGLSKAAKAAAKKQTKENIKKARRDRHDPEKSQTTTLDLLKQGIENEKDTNKSNADIDDDNEETDIKRITNLDGDSRSVTYEELRQRLHRRIEELRGNRGNGEKTRYEKREIQERKRKRGPELEEKSGWDGKNSNVGKSEDEIEKEVTEATKGIEFGKVKIGGEEEIGRKKKRKLSKAKELERAKRLEEAKKNPERGEVVAKKHSWQAATSRAAGIKVHDDPRLLKHSIQKGKKRHEKNVEKWKERVESREKMKGEKQQKRAGNIAERIHQKKMRKIAKREKKLMRPGFEGRKEGYINED
ncbi:hypothetical protein F0562_025974 [Nyssa sinensis]|uniref:Ribosomal RNA-processing protein 14/surfeit locus protein 6 C-terminal domain-containing protein n=1 Tax=Nyssa sinensis TaxID=561372 RepID=A0A5J5BBP8_9ASTE|nr:hypothetical protein F0562_025974 [Nyssa sinensis]